MLAGDKRVECNSSLTWMDTLGKAGQIPCTQELLLPIVDGNGQALLKLRRVEGCVFFAIPLTEHLECHGLLMHV